MMRIVQMAMGLVLAVALTGCLNIPGKVDLTKAAADAQVLNVTTGDGTFADYKATGYHTSTEIGIAVGIPGLKLLELDSLGGSGSRGYGKVKFVGVTIDGQDAQARFDAVQPFAR